LPTLSGAQSDVTNGDARSRGTSPFIQTPLI
jgi:hypothetical protein